MMCHRMMNIMYIESEGQDVPEELDGPLLWLWVERFISLKISSGTARQRSNASRFHPRMM